MMNIILIFIAILFFVSVVAIAFRIARKVQKTIDHINEDARKGKNKTSKYSWMGHIHSIWGVLGFAGGTIKYIYREWKTAPPDSLEKFGWLMLMSAIGAVCLWIIVKILDKTVNRPPEYELWKQKELSISRQKPLPDPDTGSE